MEWLHDLVFFAYNINEEKVFFVFSSIKELLYITQVLVMAPTSKKLTWKEFGDTKLSAKQTHQILYYANGLSSICKLNRLTDDPGQGLTYTKGYQALHKLIFNDITRIRHSTQQKKDLSSIELCLLSKITYKVFFEIECPLQHPAICRHIY